MMNQLLEIAMSRTHFRGLKGVHFIESRQYLVLYQNYFIYFRQAISAALSLMDAKSPLLYRMDSHYSRKSTFQATCWMRN